MQKLIALSSLLMFSQIYAATTTEANKKRYIEKSIVGDFFPDEHVKEYALPGFTIREVKIRHNLNYYIPFWNIGSVLGEFLGGLRGPWDTDVETVVAKLKFADEIYKLKCALCTKKISYEDPEKEDYIFFYRMPCSLTNLATSTYRTLTLGFPSNLATVLAPTKEETLKKAYDDGFNDGYADGELITEFFENYIVPQEGEEGHEAYRKGFEEGYQDGYHEGGYPDIDWSNLED